MKYNRIQASELLSKIQSSKAKPSKIKHLRFSFKILPIFLLSIIFLNSCSDELESRGYVTKFSKFEEIKKGQSKQEILSQFGSPAIISKAGDETWIYAGSEYTKETFFEPQLRGYNAFKISFDSAGLVKGVTQKDINDRKEIELSDEITETGGNEVTFIQQLLGNLGKYNPAGAAGRIGGR